MQSENAELVAQVKDLNQQLADSLLHAAPRQSMGRPHSPDTPANLTQVFLILPTCITTPICRHLLHTTQHI